MSLFSLELQVRASEELVAKQMPKRSIFIRATLFAKVTSTLLFIRIVFLRVSANSLGEFSPDLIGQISPKGVEEHRTFYFLGIPMESPNSMEKYQYVSAIFRCPKMMHRTETVPKVNPKSDCPGSDTRPKRYTNHTNKLCTSITPIQYFHGMLSAVSHPTLRRPTAHDSSFGAACRTLRKRGLSSGRAQPLGF